MYYWDEEDAALQLPPFDQFQAAFVDTQSIELETGSVNTDVGAGQTYYTVPVTLTVHTTAGATEQQTGCYVLHLGEPAAQATPPYQPLGIEAVTDGLRPPGAPADASVDRPCP
jgi:hypothetical protein